MSEEISVEKETPSEEFLPQSERTETLSNKTTRSDKQNKGYRSFFWPLVLIGAGVLWLLSNLDIIDAQNLSVLLRLWPVLLIAVGLDVLFGRRSPLIGGLLGLGLVGSVVALVIVGPSLGWTTDTPDWLQGPAEVRHSQFTEPVNGARSADISLELSSGRTRVYALSDSSTLLNADLNHVGEIVFNAHGGRDRSITLEERRDFTFAAPNFNANRLPWEIGLAPGVPLALNIDVASGPAELTLSELELTAFNLEGASGPANVDLPAGSYPFTVDVASGPMTVNLMDNTTAEVEADGGSGRFVISLGENNDVTMKYSGASGPFQMSIQPDSDVHLELEGGSGPLRIMLPAGAAVRVESREGGSGPLSLASDLLLVDDGGDDDRKTGIWETNGFSNAAHQIVIIIEDVASGPVTIR